MNTIKLFLGSLVLFAIATAQAVSPIGGGTNGLGAVSDDPAPTLGGDLNGGGHSISNVGGTTASSVDTPVFTILDSVDGVFGINIVVASDITGSNKSLTFTTGNVNRAVGLAGNLSIANDFTTSGNFGCTLTITGTTNVTLPTTGTLGTLAGVESPTNKMISGSTNTVNDSVTVTHDNTAVPNQTGGWTKYSVSSSDFSTANTAATDITGLISGTLTNNVRYEVDVDLLLLNDNDANGLKIALRANGGGTVAVNACGTVNTTSATGGNTICIGANNTLSTALQAYTNGQGTASFHGFITTSTTGTATISVAIAKATASGNAKALIGSRLWIRKADL